MDALTTQRVTGFFAPGDTVRSARGDVHSVFKMMHTGYGFAGVLLTTRAGANKHITYVTWIVTAEGEVRAVMTTDDPPAALGSFEANTVKAIRAEFREATV